MRTKRRSLTYKQMRKIAATVAAQVAFDDEEGVGGHPKMQTNKTGALAELIFRLRSHLALLGVGVFAGIILLFAGPTLAIWITEVMMLEEAEQAVAMTAMLNSWEVEDSVDAADVSPPPPSYQESMFRGAGGYESDELPSYDSYTAQVSQAMGAVNTYLDNFAAYKSGIEAGEDASVAGLDAGAYRARRFAPIGPAQPEAPIPDWAMHFDSPMRVSVSPQRWYAGGGKYMDSYEQAKARMRDFGGPSTTSLWDLF